MTVEQHIQEYSSLPQNLKEEVDSFIQTLKSRLEKISNAKEKNERPLGLLEGKVFMREDFDEPLEDFKDYM